MVARIASFHFLIFIFMSINAYILFIAAAIPLLVGMVYYNPKTMGNIWMRASGITPDGEVGNMLPIFALTYFCGLLIATALMFTVIHQMHMSSILAHHETELGDPNSELSLYVKDFFVKYGTEFRTFKHGAFHGLLSALFLATPVIAVSAMFERKGWKYIAVHAGYWVITLALMGGVICQFL